MLMMAVPNRKSTPTRQVREFAGQKLISTKRQDSNANAGRRVQLAPEVIELLARIILDDVDKHENEHE